MGVFIESFPEFLSLVLRNLSLSSVDSSLSELSLLVNSSVEESSYFLGPPKYSCNSAWRYFYKVLDFEVLVLLLLAMINEVYVSYK